MEPKPDSEAPQNVSCEVCLKEIPRPEAPRPRTTWRTSAGWTATTRGWRAPNYRGARGRTRANRRQRQGVSRHAVGWEFGTSM